jgi:hypothetical protein
MFEAKGRVGLRQSHGGFATQPYPHEGEERRLLVVLTDLVVRDDDLHGHARDTRAPITTLGAAAELAGVELAVDDRPLDVDLDAVRFVAELYAVGQAALTVMASFFVDESPAEIQLWPEHFDLATSVAEVNYGISPGDETHDQPYAYVGPHQPPPMDEFWNEPFGASRSFDAVPTVDALLTFFGEGRRRL